MHFREPSKPFVHVSVDSLPEALFRNIEHVSGHLRRLYLEVYANARGETIYPWKTSHALFLYQVRGNEMVILATPYNLWHQVVVHGPGIQLGIDDACCPALGHAEANQHVCS